MTATTREIVRRIKGRTNGANSLSILKGARALLANRRRWIKHTLSRNANKQEVGPSSSAAVCWCLEGALRAVADTREGGIALQRARNIVAAEINRQFPLACASIAHFNDTARLEDVQSVLDGAIDAREKEERL